MRKYDIATSIFWLLIGFYVFWHARTLGLGRLREPGPGFIFFYAGTFLIILSIINLLKAFLVKEHAPTPKLWSDLKWQRIIIVLIGIFIYMYFFELLGFPLATFLLLIFLFKVVEPTKWRSAILSAIVTITVCYVFFVTWLKVPFPKGFLGM